MKNLVATPAGIAALCLLVASFGVFCFAVWYVLADRRKDRTDRIANLALEDGTHE
jgi:hypothetical protein